MPVSILFNAADNGLGTVRAALVAFDGPTDHLIICTLRVPRAHRQGGTSLAVAGAIMQGIHRSSEREPGIRG